MTTRTRTRTITGKGPRTRGLVFSTSVILKLILVSLSLRDWLHEDLSSLSSSRHPRQPRGLIALVESASTSATTSSTLASADNTNTPPPSAQQQQQQLANSNNISPASNQQQLLNASNSLSLSHQQQSKLRQIQATFATPNQAINITHVTYDPIHNTIYLGATNTLYQLNGTDLSVQYELSTGPVLDNPSCGITECHGFEEFMKPTANVNKILVIDYQHKKLLSCGSTKQGACRRYQLNNIAQTTSEEDLIPMAVAANDDNSSTFAFIAPARYLSPHTPSSQRQVLYVAATYTKLGLVPAIGTRILDDGPNMLKLYENSFLDSARIDINSHLRDYFLVNYLYGFATADHVYFVTVQKKATSRDAEELGYHTRLARICITDSSYNSYTEVDLKCTQNQRLAHASPQAGFFSSSSSNTATNEPKDYPLLQDAILVDAGSQLLKSLAQTDLSSGFSSDDGKVLLGVFSSARDHTHQPGDHSALCAFSLSQIEDKFNDNIQSCYTGKMQSRNMEYIAGNVQECPKSSPIVGGNVVDFCHETLKINGTIPIVSEASIHFHNTTLTAITATSQHQARSTTSDSATGNEKSMQAADPQTATSGLNNAPRQQHTVVFAGTSNGHIKKILLNNATNGIEFEDVQVDSSQQPILSDLHLHSSGKHLIAATPYKVFKVATHNCGQYSSCRECSQSRNPYCGWCLLKKSCTTKTECSPPSASEVQRNSIPVDGAGQHKQFLQQQQQLAQQPKWISLESSGKCIDLQSIVPDKIPMTSTGKVDLHIDRLPRLPKEHSYKCVFNRSEQTSATATPFGLSCPLPKLMDRQRHIQIEPGRDHAVVELAVRSSETNTDFLDGKITFFDCQRHTTCKDCLTTNWGCNWCLNENVCLFNTSKCEKSSPLAAGGQQRQDGALVQLLGSGAPSQRLRQSPGQQQSATIIVGSQLASQQQRGSTLISSGLLGGPAGGPSARNGNTISLVQQCPTFDVGHQQDILIADGSEKELSIRVKNMPQFKGAMKCVVEIENYEISLRAQIHEDRVICENSTYSYAADVGLLQGQLKVIYSDNNIFIDRTNFTLYKCHLLGAYLNRPDCSLCQRIDSRFQCAWCSGSCRHRSKCGSGEGATVSESCPAPRIDFVHPLSGPALGGTRVTIEGSNMGQSFEEIMNRVTIGNVPCKPIEDEYRPSNRIVCLTGPVVSRFGGGGGNGPASFDSIAGDVVVGNKVGYTIGPQKFAFRSVYLRDHQPRYGPQSGGTRLTLSGTNLNIGSGAQVFLDELPCLVEPNSVTSEQLVCRTTSSRHPSRPIRQLKLIIDDALIVRDDDVFYYTADPIIHKISPLRAYLSGGRPINVFGANLTVVQAPRMAIHDSTTGKKINESACILQDDTRMQCPSPTVNLQMMDLEWAEQQLSSYDPSSQAVFSSASSGFSLGKSSSSSLSLSTTSSPGGQQMLQQDEMVKFRLSFVMDSVLQTSYPQLQTEIAYTSDPKLYAFASPHYKSAAQEAELSMASANGGGPAELPEQNYQLEPDTFLLQPGEPTLVLYGEHLRAAVSEYEITVTVGQDLCNLTQLSQTKLVCLLSLDHMATPTDEEGRQTSRLLPLVVVRIGFNLRYELGFVQYHPQLVDQILALIANLSASSSQAQMSTLGPHHPLRHPLNPSHYTQYLPRESESILHKISSFISACVLGLAYLTLASLTLALVYSGALYGARLKQSADRNREHKLQLARVESIERSLKNECRLNALSLQGDLSELVRHVELSGVPLLSTKQYIMKVFFPGMNNHPLLQQSDFNNNLSRLAAAVNGQGQQQMGADLPMEYFERLVLTKPFLLAFINTLERQPSFTIRDKVNVASLLMIVLLGKLDYATDIMKTLLFQLVERSVRQLSAVGHDDDDDDNDRGENDSRVGRTTKRLTRRASNLLSGLPISKRHSVVAAGRATSQIGKVVGGSASSLMAQTSVAAQMLLARVGGNKTSPLDGSDEQVAAECENFNACLNGCHQHPVGPISPPITSAGMLSPLDCNTLGQLNGIATSDYMSTTTFNNALSNSSGSSNNNHSSLYHHGARSNSKRAHAHSGRSSSSSLRRPASHKSRRTARDQRRHQAKLMLRRTDSIVEKMLTNWLALNMHDYFHGQVGESLYMLFEALRSQLERGPIDATSGDAYYSLNEHKLLREPNIQFEVVNLYVIVDTEILQPFSQQQQQQLESQNLLLDSANQLYDDGEHGQHQQSKRFFNTTNRVGHQQHQQPTSTITLALRVLDCDTISQVKGKILAAVYKNTPHSFRLGANDVELSLRQHQPLAAGAGGHQTLALGNQQLHQQQLQYITVSLQDEDCTSMTSYNGARRLNTLRHYGVTDQAIMMLKRASTSAQQQAANERAGELDQDHYSNPYTEIQYGTSNQQQQPPMVPQIQGPRSNRVPDRATGNRPWHLIRSEADRTSAHLSEHSNDSSSSPASHSPSMMLLGGNHSSGGVTRINGTSAAMAQQQQQFYHPSSSSTSSTGNVMDTNSTSANSMMNVNNNLLVLGHNQRQTTAINGRPMNVHQGPNPHDQHHLQQPIYCQIGSISAQSQHGGFQTQNNNGSQYYCQIGQSQNVAQHLDQYQMSVGRASTASRAKQEQEHNELLARMLTTKGTTQRYMDDFFRTILTARTHPSEKLALSGFHDDSTIGAAVVLGNGDHGKSAAASARNAHRPISGACPPAVKWIFDLLDEAAIKNGIADQNVIHAWKSNAFLLRFWMNFIKNPNYILDVEKTNTLDASLSVIAQTLMDSCAPGDARMKSEKGDTNDKNRLVFSRDLPRYKEMVRHFYQDIASMRPVSDQEMVEQMGQLSATNNSASGAGKFDTNLALKELCVYAVNYGVEIMNTLNVDYTCQQMELSQQLEQCFRSFAIFEAYQ